MPRLASFSNLFCGVTAGLLLMFLCSCKQVAVREINREINGPNAATPGSAPAPKFIEKQFGPFGPKDVSYAVPEGAIFVAPDGLASNSGASLDAPTTLEKAIRDVQTGDTIVLRGGTYRTGDLSFNKQCTIQPYLSEKPLLKGSRIADQWTKRGDVWMTKWDTMFYNDPPPWYNSERHGPPCLWHGDVVVVDGRMARPVNSMEELEENRYFCDYENGAIYLTEDPTGKTVEITVYKNGLVRTHEAGADPEGPTILGLEFYSYAGASIDINGEDPYRTISPGELPDAPLGTRIENCRFLYCSKNALRMTSPESVIAHCEFGLIGSVAVVPRMSHNGVFEHNRVFRSNYFEHLSFPAGIKVFNQGYNYTVRNNSFTDMSCIAVWYDVGLREGVVSKNYFRDCGISVKIEISHRHYIVGNVFDNSRVFLCNSANCVVYNNTFIDSRLGFMRNNRGHGQWNKRFSFDHAATGPGPKNYHGHQIANNVFYGEPTGEVALRMEDNNSYDSAFQTELFASNLFVLQSEWFAEAGFKPSDVPMTKYESLDAFESVFGDHLEGNVQLELSAEQLFESFEEGNYRLNAFPGAPKARPMSESVARMLDEAVETRRLGAL